MIEIIIAAIAFPLGEKNNPIIQRINQITNIGNEKKVQRIEMKRSIQMILKIIQTRATVLSFFSPSSNTGVKCSSLILKIIIKIKLLTRIYTYRMRKIKLKLITAFL